MISLARYGALFRVPDLKAIAIASVIGRLPIGIAGLAIMLMMQAATGSFADSGIATAGYIGGLAALAPFVGRYIDRHGPQGMLRLSMLVYPAAMLGLIACALMHASKPLLGTVAFLAGASYPPITVCMRTLLRQLLQDDARLQAAYSLESVLIETIFIAGPLLVALLVAVARPEYAVAFAALCALLGTWLFLRSPAMRRWNIEPPRRGSLLGPLATTGFTPLLCVTLLYCAGFGLFEIGVTGYAAENGSPWLSGLMLGLASVGSATGALAYGSRTWRWPLKHQYVTALACMGLGCVALSVSSHGWVFGLVSMVAGLAMSPPLIMQSMLVARIARPEHATEAFTWSSTALLTGVGVGIAAGGALLEVLPSSAVFLSSGLLAMVASALAAALIGSGRSSDPAENLPNKET